ncbi:porin family protein [Paraferrimonas sedimenticola]|uniref:Outer membrane protein beta-barrel domain-containing protein n=1 Tax=Paraferrimonas sedimenticola TaxID=375674 RepID=A0AA37RRT9_9GAMM|nr:porin family protein [Paraferrimonas sedimenticola]GLP95086.1 hypothetical protein GCM10007895_03920 [Paraferrimonas sedimenticola]
MNRINSVLLLANLLVSTNVLANPAEKNRIGFRAEASYVETHTDQLKTARGYGIGVAYDLHKYFAAYGRLTEVTAKESGFDLDLRGINLGVQVGYDFPLATDTYLKPYLHAGYLFPKLYAKTSGSKESISITQAPIYGLGLRLDVRKFTVALEYARFDFKPEDLKLKSDQMMVSLGWAF